MADLQERVRSLEADNARLSYALHERTTEVGRMREELASHDRGASGEGLPARASESAALEGKPSSTLQQASLPLQPHRPKMSPCTVSQTMHSWRCSDHVAMALIVVCSPQFSPCRWRTRSNGGLPHPPRTLRPTVTTPRPICLPCTCFPGATPAGVWCGGAMLCCCQGQSHGCLLCVT